MDPKIEAARAERKAASARNVVMFFAVVPALMAGILLLVKRHHSPGFVYGAFAAAAFFFAMYGLSWKWPRQVFLIVFAVVILGLAAMPFGAGIKPLGFKLFLLGPLLVHLIGQRMKIKEGKFVKSFQRHGKLAPLFYLMYGWEHRKYKASNTILLSLVSVALIIAAVCFTWDYRRP